LPGCDSGGAGRRREDAAVSVLPADADAEGILLEYLLDHPGPAWLCHFLGLDGNPVSGVRFHLCLSLLFSGLGRGDLPQRLEELLPCKSNSVLPRLLCLTRR